MKFKRPDAVAELMGRAGAELPKATHAFKKLTAAPIDDRPRLLDKLQAVEQECDELNGKLLNKIVSTFVTPFDREDMYSMVERIDNVVDELEHVGSLIVGFRLEQLPDEFVANADMLNEMAELCAQAPDLIKKPKKLDSLLADIDKVENRLDRGYEQLILTILVPDADPIHAIRIKTLADGVEFAATLMEEFVIALGITAIKET